MQLRVPPAQSAEPEVKTANPCRRRSKSGEKLGKDGLNFTPSLACTQFWGTLAREA